MLDILMSLLLILLIFPLLILVFLISLIFIGSPVFFIQERAGLNNKVFEIYKFRSMMHKSEKFLNDELRMIWYGRVLRALHIDEFPQLFNILRGDMSFIGPRPLLPEYLPYYTKRELRRHEVRPGLSGLSQVSGTYPPWEEQFEFDIQYVDNLTFKLDTLIFFKTILKVLSPSKKLLRGEVGRLRFDVYRKDKM
jgi:undecaprenyl phosphate N,N'-diacetylbacillosamine 1-phosphate transferase